MRRLLLSIGVELIAYIRIVRRRDNCPMRSHQEVNRLFSHHGYVLVPRYGICLDKKLHYQPCLSDVDSLGIAIEDEH
jgi:hypothetical protein